jgi:hypothetical protein
MSGQHRWHHLDELLDRHQRTRRHDLFGRRHDEPDHSRRCGRSIEETDSINREPTSRVILTPAPDGSLAIRIENLKVGTTTTYKVIKQ